MSTGASAGSASSAAASAVASASSTSTPADGLSFTVAPMSGPARGGTSLELHVSRTADQRAADHALATTTAHIAGVALSCTHADAALRCCCTPPRAGNGTQSIALVLYRSLLRATTPDAAPDGGTNSSSLAAAVETAVLETPLLEVPVEAPVEAPVETRLAFRYYEDPKLLRLSPVRGSSNPKPNPKPNPNRNPNPNPDPNPNPNPTQVRGSSTGESVTIFAQGWPLPSSSSLVAADAARCRFGPTTSPVPAAVLLTATGTAKVICTSPDLTGQGLGGAAAGAVAVAVAPNGLDFVNGEPALVFRHALQTWAHMLAALAVLLAVLLLLRAYARSRRLALTLALALTLTLTLTR